jgi:hypothetical protein
VATAVDFVGLIYLLILAVCLVNLRKLEGTVSSLKGAQFVVTMEHYAARVTATHLEDRLTFKWLIAIRIVNPIIMYFFVSVCSAYFNPRGILSVNRHE